MKIQIISDMHIDFNEFEIFNNILVPSADILLILGDIGSAYTDNYEDFLDYCSENWKYTIFVSGNHEYYMLSSKIKTFQEIDLYIKGLSKRYTNIYYLNKDYVEISNYIFLGTTLWSNVNEEDSKYMNDYSCCYYNQNNNLTRNDVIKEYKNNVKWLKSKIEEFKDKKIIILTHHLPFLYIEEFEEKPNTAYCSDLLKEFVDYKNIIYWFCGHIHEKINYKLEHIKVLSNPLGYNNIDSHIITENYKFFVVEL